MNTFRNPIVIVLTACVNPGGMSFTVLQDANERKRQYVEALNYYLTTTSLPIVFIENSNTDFSYEFLSWIEQGRLEYITFDGNTGFDKIKGKGYGEALMLLYAIEHSSMIRQCKYLIKITGRLQVQNINKIASSWTMNLSRIWRSNIQSSGFSTTVFVSNPWTLKYLLLKHKEEITEEDRGHNWIENVLYRAFLTEDSIKDFIVPFLEPPIFDAFSGTSHSKYIIESTAINATDNLFRSAEMEKRRGYLMRYVLMKSLFYLYILKFKIAKNQL